MENTEVTSVAPARQLRTAQEGASPHAGGSQTPALFLPLPPANGINMDGASLSFARPIGDSGMTVPRHEAGNE